MTVEAVSGITSTSSTSTITEQTLGQEAFLELLVVQLQNQDPLDPVTNEDLVAQLATFSSLEQLVAVNENLEEIALLETSMNNSEAVNLIGKQITVSGDLITLKDGEASTPSFVLEDSATSVTVEIRNSDGIVVRTMELGSLDTSLQEVEWDGLDNNGEALEDGTYTYSVTASGEDGLPVSADQYCRVLVEGVTFSDGYAYLISGDYAYVLSDIIEVRGE